MKKKKQSYHFPVIIEKDEDDFYVAIVPHLKGCHTQAKDLTTLLNRVKEAIELCVQAQSYPPIQNEFVAFHEMEITL